MFVYVYLFEFLPSVASSTCLRVELLTYMVICLPLKKKYQTIFHKGFIILHPHEQCITIPVVNTSLLKIMHTLVVVK